MINEFIINILTKNPLLIKRVFFIHCCYEEKKFEYFINESNQVILQFPISKYIYLSIFRPFHHILH